MMPKKEVINNEKNDELYDSGNLDRYDYDYALIYMLFHVSSAQDA